MGAAGEGRRGGNPNPFPSPHDNKTSPLASELEHLKGEGFWPGSPNAICLVFPINGRMEVALNKDFEGLFSPPPPIIFVLMSPFCLLAHLAQLVMEQGVKGSRLPAENRKIGRCKPRSPR